MRVLILTLSAPYGKAVTYRLQPRNAPSRCAERIRAFAAANGIAIYAVDYTVTWAEVV